MQRHVFRRQRVDQRKSGESHGAHDRPGKQVEQSFTAKDFGQVPYLLYLPNDFQMGKDRRPLMLFLHGRGESNGPLSLVAKWGPPLLVERGETFPFIVVSPQIGTTAANFLG